VVVGVLPEGSARPNIILVLIDTLRADRLGAYGNARGLSPNLDAFAAAGVTFERAIAPSSWTMPSMASIFTACYPSVHKVTRFQKPTELNDPNFQLSRLPEKLSTLAEALEIEGYATAGFTANPFTLQQYGFADGFGVFDERFAVSKATGDGRKLTDAALDWLQRRDASRPFFLYVHYMDVHGPYDAPPEYFEPLLEGVEASPRRRELEKYELENLDYLDSTPPGIDEVRHIRMRRYQEYWAARYDAGVREMDDHFADLQARLRQAGVWDAAYVIVTSDHGEALAEHGWWDHGYSVHHPEVHVPLLLRWPGVLPAGRRVPHVCSLVGLAPTVLAQLRIAPLADVQGESLLPLLADAAPARTPEAFVEFVRVGAQQKGLYRGDWKLLYFTVGSTSRQLFDMKADSLEQSDVSAANGSTADAMYAAVVALIKDNERRAREIELQMVNVINRDSLANHGYFNIAADGRRGTATRPAATSGSGPLDAP
jgi:arylsulfatase